MKKSFTSFVSFIRGLIIGILLYKALEDTIGHQLSYWIGSKTGCYKYHSPYFGQYFYTYRTSDNKEMYTKSPYTDDDKE